MIHGILLFCFLPTISHAGEIRSFASQQLTSVSSPTFASLTLTTPLAVGSGGTGDAALTSNGVLFGNGTSAVSVTTQGGANTVLFANNGAPSFTNTPTITGTNITSIPAASINAGSLGTGVIASSIAASGVTANTYGDATHVSSVTIGGDGRVTSASNIAITPTAASIQSGSLGTGVIASSIAATTFANPSASLGLSAVNGSATTPMRSDAAPALSQAITPTWTGAHAFQAQTTFGSGASISTFTSTGVLTLNSALAVGSGGTGLTSVSSNGLTYGNGASALNVLSQGTGVLQESAGAPSWTTTPTLTGTNITSIPAASINAGSLGTGVIASSLAVNGVASGTYGNATNVSSITVGSDGRITSVANVGITPTAASIQGGSLGATVIASSIAASVVVNSNLASGSFSNITGVGTLTAGTWNATKVGLAYGGTNTDLSGTGGTSQYLKQASLGGLITVGTIPASDIQAGSLGASVIASSIAATTFVNPTASLGLSAVNGTATTPMRSDGAPALSQSIAPTWTAVHTFSAAPVITTITANGIFSISTAASVGAIATPDLYINTAGNVGIGTSSPSSTLHVSTSSSIVAIFDRTGGGGASIKLNNGATSFSQISHSYSLNETQIGPYNQVTALVVDTNGNVGIATTSPSAFLDVLSGTTGNGTRPSSVYTSAQLQASTPTALGIIVIESGGNVCKSTGTASAGQWGCAAFTSGP